MSEPIVEVELEGGGYVVVTDLDQLIGVATRVVVRDRHGRDRVTAWGDLERLRDEVRRKLARATPVPAVEAPLPAPPTPAPTPTEPVLSPVATEAPLPEPGLYVPPMPAVEPGSSIFDRLDLLKRRE